jgi:hypothetical protein
MPTTRQRVIDGAIAKLNETYVFPETVKKMEGALRARQNKGEYDAANEAEDFAQNPSRLEFEPPGRYNVGWLNPQSGLEERTLV